MLWQLKYGERFSGVVKQAVRAKREPPPDYIDPPQLVDGLLLFFEAFVELVRFRDSTGHLSLVDLYAYADENHFEGDHRRMFVDYIGAMNLVLQGHEASIRQAADKRARREADREAARKKRRK